MARAYSIDYDCGCTIALTWKKDLPYGTVETFCEEHDPTIAHEEG